MIRQVRVSLVTPPTTSASLNCVYLKKTAYKPSLFSFHSDNNIDHHLKWTFSPRRVSCALKDCVAICHVVGGVPRSAAAPRMTTTWCHQSYTILPIRTPSPAGLLSMDTGPITRTSRFQTGGWESPTPWQGRFTFLRALG